MVKFYTPPANPSLFTKGSEAGHARRWQIYLLKIVQGALTALAMEITLRLTAFIPISTPGYREMMTLSLWQRALVWGVATFVTIIAEKVVDQVDRKWYLSGFNPLDLITDVALHQAWLIPFEIRYAWPLAIAHILCFAAYPWSEE